jgi:hypothetical protein
MGRVERTILRFIGRPRTALVVGFPDVSTELVQKGVQVDDAPRDGARYDLLVVSSGDRARELSPRLEDGGHVVVGRGEVGADLEVLRRKNGVTLARSRPKPGKLSLTVGMLTLNEEQSVEKMIDDIREVAPDAAILLIDSSNDKTPDLARAKGAEVIRQVPPRGHGPAMERLMYETASRTDALIYIDCDFTYPTKAIPRLRELLEEGADVVNATRTHHYPPAMPLPNFGANRVFAGVAQIVHGIPTTDLHSGLRGYRSSVTRALSFTGEQDALPVTTLVLPAKLNYHVVDFPIDYAERVGQSKLAKFRGTFWTFARIAQMVGQGQRVGSSSHYTHV